MEHVKDSSLVNFANSIDAIHRKLSTPKQGGVRDRNPGGEAELEANLAQHMVSIVTSPLSQLETLVPVPGLSAAQVKALRALYALIKDKPFSNDVLKAAVDAAVKLLNPSSTFRTNTEKAEKPNNNVE
ncbi:hypothetical protein MMC11_006206 [Xylographa trunciseda]|nr:hypothetical protein [Xylographa trunciseda]